MNKYIKRAFAKQESEAKEDGKTTSKTK